MEKEDYIRMAIEIADRYIEKTSKHLHGQYVTERVVQAIFYLAGMISGVLILGWIIA